MRTLLILALFVLFLGCVQQSVPSEGTETPPQPQEQPQPPEEEQQPTAGEPPPQGETTAPEESNPFEGLRNIKNAMDLGLSGKCEFRGTDYEGTAYFSADGKRRYEVRALQGMEQGECRSTILVEKEGIMYMKCADSNAAEWRNLEEMFRQLDIAQRCDWLAIAPYKQPGQPEEDMGGRGVSVDTTGFEDIQEREFPEISCMPWVVDASKFDTSGEICNLDDLARRIQDMSYGGMPNAGTPPGQ